MTFGVALPAFEQVAAVRYYGAAMSPELAAGLLLWRLLVLHDRGEVAELAAVQTGVVDGTLFRWLHAHYDVDVGVLAEAVLLGEFGRLLDTCDAARQFGVRRNGLTLLLAWCVELYQQGQRWT